MSRPPFLHLGAGIMLTFAGACGPAAPDASETDANATGSTSSTSPTSTSPTTGTPSTSETTSFPGPTTGVGSTGVADTTGGTSPGLEDSCAAFCAAAFGCLKPNPYPDLASCEWLCLNNIDAEQPLCIAASIAANECLAGLTCPELSEALGGGEPGVCGPAIMARDDACLSSCKFGIVTGPPSNCSMSQACLEQLPTLFECSGDTCTCTIGDEVQKQCPAAGICDEGWEPQAMAANACCGFDF